MIRAGFCMHYRGPLYIVIYFNILFLTYLVVLYKYSVCAYVIMPFQRWSGGCEVSKLVGDDDTHNYNHAP